MLLVIPIFDFNMTYATNLNTITSTSNTTSNLVTYENSTLGIKINYPSDWTIEYNKTDDYEFVQVSNETDPSIYYLQISISPLTEGEDLLHRIIAQTINDFKINLPSFELIDVVLTKLDNRSTYKMLFTYTEDNIQYKELKFSTILGNKIYDISYSAELGVFDKWLDIFQNMIKSLEIKPTLYTYSEISPIGKNNDLAVNPSINTIYIVNYDEDAIYVINGTDNRKKSYQITVNSPSGIAIDTVENNTSGIVFVPNKENNMVSVITGNKYFEYVFLNIPVGVNPLDVDVNSITNRIYVANAGSNTVSVIDYSINNTTFNHTTLGNITVGLLPSQISVNPVTNRIYVANAGSNTVSVINGSNNKIIQNISVGIFPSEIGINPITNRIYVANAGSNASSYNYVSVIDGITNRIIENITLGNLPYGGHQIAINPSIGTLGTLYVTDPYADNLYIIDASTNKILHNITLPNPSGIAISTTNNNVYIGNLYNNRTFIIDGLNHEIIRDSATQTQISFTIYGSGSFYCGEYYFDPANQNYSFFYNNGTEIECSAIPERGFLFDRWEIDHNPVENSTEKLTFIASNQTSLSANFKEVIPRQLFTFIIVIAIITAVLHIIHWKLILFREKRLIQKYSKKIESISDIYSTDRTKNLKYLEQIKNEISKLLGYKKISQKNYNNLYEKILEKTDRLKDIENKDL